MQSIQREVLAPYTPEQMYALVNDVATYPQFVPYCHRTQIVSESETQMCAKMTFSWQHFEQSFVTQNQLTAVRKIAVSLVDGPFRSLQGVWEFLPHETGCLVRLDFTFELPMGMLKMVFEPIFYKVINDLITVFLSRARVVYG